MHLAYLLVILSYLSGYYSFFLYKVFFQLPSFYLYNNCYIVVTLYSFSDGIIRAVFVLY